jgi:integrase/recombinase XerD
MLWGGFGVHNMLDDKAKHLLNRTTRQKLDGLEAWITAFLRDGQARELSAFTVKFYRKQLIYFVEFCKGQDVNEASQITAPLIREFVLSLKSSGHNEGGRHAAFRALRAFLRWWERETEPTNWTNPLTKVIIPSPKNAPIEPVPTLDVKAMLTTCADDFMGYRDKALLLCLLDTGARAREFMALALDDVDFISGAVTIHKGKGSKGRTVFVGKKSRKALRAYLKRRADDCPALWVTDEREPLAVASLRQILIRRAKRANVSTPSPHDFRRAFALNMLRAGVDIFSLQKLMGHASLDVLRRYLAQNTDDIKAAHDKGSPVDRLL